MKITLPYALLAALFALAGAYIVSRVAYDTIQNRFLTQLAEAGRLSADQMAEEEQRLIEALRLLANVEGMAEAVAAADAARMRDLALPIAVNQGLGLAAIVDARGASTLWLRQAGSAIDSYESGQGEDFSQWPAVARVFAAPATGGRDKFAGLIRAPWGDYFVVAGPIYAADDSLAGAVLVGQSLPRLAGSLRRNTLAQTSFYGLDGRPLASSFAEVQPIGAGQAADVLRRQDEASLARSLAAAGATYSEIIGPWEAGDGEDLGLLGTALLQDLLVQPSRYTQVQIFSLVGVAFVLVVAVGVWLSNRITQRLREVVSASADVAQGNLEVRVQPAGNDELAVLADTFNHMVGRLREGAIYRDLLGRTVSPEVREQLRHTFTSGEVQLEGQEVTATILMADIRNFTALAEKTQPQQILAWLNEYFGALVPIITQHGGVVNNFSGDSLLAFFGILPAPLAPGESARLACQAAVDILRAVEQLNAAREARGDPPLVTGIGVNTGRVTAGAVGTADRLLYTVIGDAVNTTQRLEGITREFGESAVAVGEQTILALGLHYHDFHFQMIGIGRLKGKTEELLVFRLWPPDTSPAHLIEAARKLQRVQLRAPADGDWSELRPAEALEGGWPETPPRATPGEAEAAGSP